MHRPAVTREARERARVPGELSGRLAGLSLPKQVVLLAVWPFIEQIMGFVVNSVDLVLAGRMSAGAERVAILDGLGLGSYLSWLMMLVQGAVGTGVLALVSRAAGAHRQEEATEGLAQGLMVGLLTGFSAGAIIRLLLPFLIGRFGLSPAAAGSAGDYLSVLVFSCPIIGTMLAATNGLRAIGDTRSPFLAMVVVNVVNAGLSWLLVMGPEPFGGMGVRGLAIGTVLGWLAGLITVLLILWLRRTHGTRGVDLSLRDCRFRPHWHTMRRIARVGIPQAAEMFGMWLINSVTLNFISRLALSGSVGAHIIAIRIESLSFLPGFAIGTAGATLVGQYLGAENPDKAARAVRICWRYAAVFMGMIGLGFLFFPEEFVRLILPSTDPEAEAVVRRAVPLVMLCGGMQPILATTMVMKTSLRGAGATPTVMKGAFSSMIVFRAILVAVGVRYFHFGLFEIWIAMICDIAVQAVLFTWIHFRGGWKRTVV